MFRITYHQPNGLVRPVSTHDTLRDAEEAACQYAQGAASTLPGGTWTFHPSAGACTVHDWNNWNNQQVGEFRIAETGADQ